METQVQLLVATTDPDSIELYRALVDSALQLLPLDIAVNFVTTQAEVVQHVAASGIDVVLIDWQVAGAKTDQFIRLLATTHPFLCLIAVIPLNVRQYREQVWNAGAWACIPKEHLDQEWLHSVLCLICRHKPYKEVERLKD